MLFFVAILSVISLIQSNVSGLGIPIEERSRIVGGKDADIKDFPHQISLYLKGKHNCGGSIYKSNIIITAAHCVDRHDCEDLSIGAGSANWSEPQQVANTQKCIYHERWSNYTFDNDIAVVVLDSHLTFTETVQPIHLAKQMPVPGTKVTVTGWGDTQKYGSPDILQEVDVELVSNDQCSKAGLPVPITDRMLCAGVEQGGKDSCQGDSGGPLINTANRELLGVVSFGKGCALKGKPGAYASIPNLYNWIVKTVKDNGGL